MADGIFDTETDEKHSPCGNCGFYIPYDRTTSHCPRCDIKLAPRFWDVAPVVVNGIVAQVHKQDTGPNYASASPEAKREATCIGIGVVFAAIGAYFLLSPSEGSAEFLGRSVVNMHRLYLGQTCALVGAIFIAVGIRPR